MAQKVEQGCRENKKAQDMSPSINADVMTVEEIHQKLATGYKDIEKGRVQNAAEAFEELRKTRKDTRY